MSSKTTTTEKRIAGQLTLSVSTSGCVNGEKWCPGTDTDKLPCFDCYTEDA
ncbi:hypothetical protein [Haladaptatus cibarius]|uniref:hypothetical protein n=1 Tax=Haladaptatus cibarius TaxID=453847 RepID=UPI00130E69AB|nr:hypothetical protein [Haladaptatus cibarius]